MLKNIDGIIFDLDGTLVDSMWLWEQIDIDFLADRGIVYPEDFRDKIEGMSFTESAQYSIERFDLKENVEDLKEIWNKMAIDKYTNHVKYKPYAKEFLEYLSDKKIHMAIATSNSPELLSAVVSSLNIDKYITKMITSCEVDRGKPFPDVFLKAASDIGVAPEKSLVFEDIVAGIKAGKAAGMKVCAVYDVHSMYQDEEKRLLADYYIRDFKELM